VKQLRSSGYVSRLEEIWYGQASPLYDWMTWWCFLPLGGEVRCRREFVRWFDIGPGQKVLSLCCGTGTMEACIADAVPNAGIVAVDLGTGQIARARQKNRSRNVDFRVANAADTGLADDSFDRVLITLALHEMPAELRLRVIGEARRLCKPDGRVIAIEHGRPPTFAAWLLRHLWWFTWIPGNPEAATTRDLQRRGLDNEMAAAGLRVVERYATRWSWIEGYSGIPQPMGP
jgi:ubiquinone/menaquinone biosynthesis C-methylase UbiE